MVLLEFVRENTVDTETLKSWCTSNPIFTQWGMLELYAIYMGGIIGRIAVNFWPDQGVGDTPLVHLHLSSEDPLCSPSPQSGYFLRMANGLRVQVFPLYTTEMIQCRDLLSSQYTCQAITSYPKSKTTTLVQGTSPRGDGHDFTVVG